jgi:inositol-polyphosphate multikinase
MTDPDGELFIKPCTQREVDFYQTVNRRHADFASIMPIFMGTLALTDPAELSSDGVSASGTSEGSDQEGLTKPKPAEEVEWKPSNKSKKIETDVALVLDNATLGFKQPNILDAKLGVRLYADYAPTAKKQRFDKISAETTHMNLGFRIAGMRIWQGSDDKSELSEKDGYKTYDKDYGRLQVSEDNVMDNFRDFVFNQGRTGIDEALGKAICAGFVHDLRRIEEVLSRNETRMYSASCLFIYEGEGKALEEAIRVNNEMVMEFEKNEKPTERSALRVDSGICMDDPDELVDDVDEEDGPVLPKMFAVKLIDFAHASFMPGHGPDENSLKGVRSLIRIFEELAA